MGHEVARVLARVHARARGVVLSAARMPAVVIIYRVENHAGIGPYSTTTTPGLCGIYAASTPAHDRRESRHRGLHFGFRSWAALGAWFTVAERQQLSSEGFVVAEYHTPKDGPLDDTVRSQVIFNRAEATLVWRHPL